MVNNWFHGMVNGGLATACRKLQQNAVAPSNRRHNMEVHMLLHAVQKQSARPIRVLLAVALLSSVSVPPAFALDNVRREIRHYFECLNLMIKDPAGHSEHCAPNRVPDNFGTLSSTNTSAPPPPSPAPAPPAPPAPVVPVPAVAEPPAPPPAPDPCPCGACYAT